MAIIQCVGWIALEHHGPYGTSLPHRKADAADFWFYTIVLLAQMMNAIPGTISGHLAPPFVLVHGAGHDKQTWIPYSLSATATTRKTATNNNQNTKRTPWTASLLGVPLRQTLSWSTTQDIDNTRRQTVTVSTLTASPHPSMLTPHTTAVSSATCFAITIPIWKRSTPPVHVSNC